jgi:hypothetical protein
MSLTIELPPDVESRLQEEASKRGQAAGEYARTLLESLLLPSGQRPFYETATPEEWVQAFRAWVASHDTTQPPLPPEALTREHFYGPSR